jgi:hypothetical protein
MRKIFSLLSLVFLLVFVCGVVYIGYHLLRFHDTLKDELKITSPEGLEFLKNISLELFITVTVEVIVGLSYL